MPKQINKEEFIKLAENNTRHIVAKHFGIADMTAQRLADDLKIEFKPFERKKGGRKKIELI